MSGIMKGFIDVKKINKARLVTKEDKCFLNITLIPTPDNKYGTHMIVEDISEEERKSGKKGTILGNIKKPKGWTAPDQPAQSTKISPTDDVPW